MQDRESPKGEANGEKTDGRPLSAQLEFHRECDDEEADRIVVITDYTFYF